MKWIEPKIEKACDSSLSAGPLSLVCYEKFERNETSQFRLLF